MRPACLQSSQHDWLRASGDGISDARDAVVEIKCGESYYRETAQSRRVPDYCYGQLQHILAVTGLPLLDFWCYLPSRPELLVVVKRNNTYIEHLISAELKFWNRVQRMA